jgi:hypothetical protein
LISDNVQSEQAEKVKKSATMINNVATLDTVNLTLKDIHSTLIGGIAISSSMTAALAGVADAIPDLKSMAKLDYLSLISKLNTVFAPMKKSYQGVDLKAKEEGKKEKTAEQLLLSIPINVFGEKGGSTKSLIEFTVESLMSLKIPDNDRMEIEKIAGKEGLFSRLSFSSMADIFKPLSVFRADGGDKNYNWMFSEIGKDKGKPIFQVSGYLDSMIGMVKKIAELKNISDDVKDATIALQRLQMADFGGIIADFARKIVDNDVIKSLILPDSNPEIMRIRDIDSKISMLDVSDENYELKKNRLLDQKSNIDASSMSPGVQLTSAVSSLTSVMGGFSFVSKFGLKTFLKLKLFGKLNYGSIIGSFIKGVFSDKNVVQLGQPPSKNFLAIQTINAKHDAFLQSDKYLSMNPEQRAAAISHYEDSVKNLRKSRGESVSDVIASLTTLLSSFKSVSEFGVKALLKFKVLNTLDFGGTIKKFFLEFAFSFYTSNELNIVY